MDFFKSVFSADPDPSPPDSPNHPSPDDDDDDDHARSDQDPTATAASASSGHNDASPSPPAATGGAGGMWSFGGLIQTLSHKSESVIQTYRRDLEEFGSGLRKETVAFREAAARAVLDLPGSLEASASAAQESLETVGQAIDEIGGTVWRGTTGIIAQGKGAILAMEAAETAANSSKDFSSDPQALKKTNSAAASKPYSRFEAQLIAIQSDFSTFSEEPEDAEDFRRWREEFDLAAKEEEIEILCYENLNLEGFLEKLVPKVLDFETFWCRYYYRVHKLKQAEDARSELVKRVIARDDEEDLSWEVDDDEEDEAKKEEEKQEKKSDNLEEEKEEKKDDNLEKHMETKKDNKEEDKDGSKSVSKEILEPLTEQKSVSKELAEPLAEKEVTEVPQMETQSSKNDEEDTSMARMAETSPSADDEVRSKLDVNTALEVKGENLGSGKDIDFSVVSSLPFTPDEDDLGWDEIEDLGEHDDKKAAKQSGSPPKVDILKRLSTADDDDEDLSWDIEDDDEPAKP